MKDFRFLIFFTLSILICYRIDDIREKKTLKFAVVKTLLICISYFFISFGLGILLAKSGWNWVFGLAMSVFIYTGAFQFALASFMASATSVLTCILTVVFIII